MAKVSVENENSRDRFARGRQSERAMKRKICVYVSEDLVSRLAVAAEQRGATKGLLKNNLVTFPSTLPFRSYCVVPFPMKVMRKHVDGGELRV